MWLTGRWGYSKNFPGTGGGISTEKLTHSKKVENPAITLRKKILNLISTGKVDQAFDCLMDCSATYEDKEIFFNKFFIESL